MQSLQFNKFTRSFIIIVCALAVMIIDGYVGSGKAQQFVSIKFNDTEQFGKTFQVNAGNPQISQLDATANHTTPRIFIGLRVYRNNVLTFSDKISQLGTIYGTWHYSLSNSSFCNSEVNYYCSSFWFAPNNQRINNIPLGTTVRLELFYTPSGHHSGGNSTNIYFERSDLDITWRDHETRINDDPISLAGNDTHIINIDAYIGNRSELSFELWTKVGFNDVTKQSLTRGTYTDVVSFAAWFINSTYGTWVVSESNNCPLADDGKICFRAYYLTNTSGANLSGKNITMELRITKVLGNHSETQSLEFKIYGKSLLTFDWKNENSEEIITGNQLKFDDVAGTAVIFKRKTNSFSFEVNERLISTQSFDNVVGSTQIINDYEAYPLGDNFKYGTWFVETSVNYTNDPHSDSHHLGNMQFLFRPKTEEINSILNTDENIISSLKFYIRESGSSSNEIHSVEATVTINRATVKPILSITSRTSSVIEGQTVTFTVQSNVDPMQPFYVSYIPTNSNGDYLDSTTSTSGFPQFEYLTFSQTEGLDEWTDEIEVYLREVDGVAGGDGSITVTLNTATDYAFYFAAAEPDNSVTIRVEDAEKPTLSFAENEYSVTEGDTDTNVELTLNLSEAIDDAVIVSYSIIERSATSGIDFVDIANGSVSILPNTTSIPINIQIKGDELSESDETFKVVISTPPSNAYFRHGVPSLEADVTIHDDEPIIMNVATTDFNVAEDVVNGNFIVEVVLTKNTVIANPNDQTPDSVSFLVETSSGTATIDADFKTPDRLPTAPRFNIPTDAKTFSFAIPILNDVENEGNETFNLRIHDLQQATFADGTTEHSLELTIIDNEKPTLSFMQDTKTVEEEDSNSNVELTLNLSGPIEEAVDISYEVIAESATEGTDFVNNGTGSVSIAANTTSIPISIQIKGDDINEGNETFKVRVTTPPNNAAFANGVSMLEATITIVDDESPTLSIDSSTLTISELAEMTHIGITLSGPTNEDVVVTYSTSITGSDTAQQADFIAQIASTITIATSPPPASPSTFGLIQIPITNDTDEEEDETFTLTLTGISGAVFAADQSSIEEQVTIIDDEGLPILTIDSDQIAVNEQSGYAEIDLSFTPAITEPVTIVYSTIQDTAVGGVDYTIQTNATLEITTGNQETIFIPIANDNSYEGEEKFSMEISAIQGAAYGTDVINNPIIITITDDETEPTITISAFSCEYGEPIPTNFSVNELVGNLIFNAKLSHPSQNPVTFNYSATVDSPIQADSATSADFYESSATQYTIQSGSICTEIVTPITHDELVEEDEQFNVAFTTNTATNIIPAFKVKIEDDDVALWNIEDLAMNEGDSNTEMAFRVYLSTPVYETVQVKWTASTIVGNTAIFGKDYAPDHNSYTGYVNILAGRIESFINGLEITGDTIFEPDETFVVTLSDPEDGTQIGDGVAIGTIINDDSKPALSISTISQVNGN